ncbi:hypothetical protein E0L36_25170 [Streptomyces sp. AJS327]|uniref:hypothetical protein n=1 Tax=Streptomyces sp. AJS327 TaxID=2545265 RepID=UPI0015DF41E2|nr:hypothetical protein [Streptomyces sp. AJS327]MBA0054021.1 hypothetical protein [Streptomyces sp. AJS327]
MTTKHTHRVVFGRRVADCPRCEELAAGAEPVRWSTRDRHHHGYPTARQLREHSCRTSGCGPVCTYGDW